MYVASGDGHFVRVNPALGRLLGWTREELLVTPIAEFVHPDERDSASAELSRAAGEGSVATCECRFRTKSGTYRWLQWAMAGDQDRGLVRGTGRDISARREAEATQAALLRIAHLVATGAGPPEVFQAVADELAYLLGVEAGVVFRLEDGFGVAVGATGPHDIRRGARVPIGRRGALARVCATAAPGRVDVAQMTPDEPIRLVYARNGYRASVAAPVSVDGRMWGAVLASTTRSDPLPDDAERRLKLFSQLVSAAIANAEAQRRMAAHAAEQSALNRVATLVAEQTEPQEVLALAAEEAARILGADAGGVVRFSPDDDGGTVVAAWSAPGLPRPALGAEVPLRGATAAAAVFRTGRPGRIDGDAGRDSETGRLVPDSPYRRDAAAPVRVGGRLWGAVTVALAGDRPLARDAEERLGRFAHLVELAISSTDARARLATLATTDALTGLWNRAVFQERLEAEVARAHRRGRPLCLAVLDLDHFKAVNDTHGHQTGDQVLGEVSRRLLAVSRTGETLARLGGEEFAWILPETDLPGALTAAERAREAIRGAPIGAVERITVSIGLGERGEGSDPQELFRLADAALYQAKAEGRDLTRPGPSG
jgi:diguanylate cyclase (GGDEF)-like protein/PAS domain S-box-containing protein